jgi:hypothetical protein
LPDAVDPGEVLAQAVEEAAREPEAEEAAPGPVAADARVLRLQHSLRRVRRQNRRLRKRVQALELKVEALQDTRPGLGASLLVPGCIAGLQLPSPIMGLRAQVSWGSPGSAEALE